MRSLSMCTTACSRGSYTCSETKPVPDADLDLEFPWRVARDEMHQDVLVLQIHSSENGSAGG